MTMASAGELRRVDYGVYESANGKCIGSSPLASSGFKPSESRSSDHGISDAWKYLHSRISAAKSAGYKVGWSWDEKYMSIKLHVSRQYTLELEHVDK
jgi:hypothetical protein